MKRQMVDPKLSFAAEMATRAAIADNEEFRRQLLDRGAAE